MATWVRGSWTHKFGVETRWEQDNSNYIGGARPDYSFVGLYNLANDAPVFEGLIADPRTGGPPQVQRYFRTCYWGGFSQNDWKVRQNLTLTLGLRYEYFSPIREARHERTMFGHFVDAIANVGVELFEAVEQPLERKRVGEGAVMLRQQALAYINRQPARRGE